MTTGADNLQAVIDTATRAARPAELSVGNYYAWITPSGTVKEIDLTGDAYRDAPRAKRGTVTLTDVGSFLAYYTKHHDADSELYADAAQLTITAVLDAHTETGPRFGQHRAVLHLRTTEAWQQWVAKDNRLMPQEEFAEHLEDHLAELVAPPAAEMLEIAQSFQASIRAEFQSSTRLSNGQRQFQFVETVTSKAGQKGQLTIPETFEIGLVPFEGAAPYKVTARFRHRIEGDRLRLAYKLERPGDVLRAAFADVLTAVTNAVEQPVMNGNPAR